MATRSWTAIRKSRIMFLASTVGLAVFLASAGTGLALPKGPTYNQCGCACQGSTGGEIDTFNNTAQLDCGAYNGQTCSYTDPQTGGVRQGTLKYCGGYKPGGTQAMIRPPGGINPINPSMQPPTSPPKMPGTVVPGMTAPITPRSVEGEPATTVPTEQEEKATAPK